MYVYNNVCWQIIGCSAWLKIWHIMSLSTRFMAGRLVGLADCYAAIVLADNATFLLPVNRIAAFRSHLAFMFNAVFSSCGSAGRASASQSWGRRCESHLGQDFFTCLCPLRHTRSMQNYPILASAERATPIPHSLGLIHLVYSSL